VKNYLQLNLSLFYWIVIAPNPSCLAALEVIGVS